MTIPKTDDFQTELDGIFAFADRKKLHSVTIRSGNLHEVVGGYPKTTNHRMPACCEVMYNNMKWTDEIISAPPKGKGANLIIKYYFPR